LIVILKGRAKTLLKTLPPFAAIALSTLGMRSESTADSALEAPCEARTAPT
jgi:hypothetical protein